MEVEVIIQVRVRANLGADRLLRNLRIRVRLLQLLVRLSPRGDDCLVGLLLRHHPLGLEGHLHILLVALAARDILLCRDRREDRLLERVWQLDLRDLQRLDLRVQLRRKLLVEVSLHRERNTLLVVEEGVRAVVARDVGDRSGRCVDVHGVVLALVCQVELVEVKKWVELEELNTTYNVPQFKGTLKQSRE